MIDRVVKLFRFSLATRISASARSDRRCSRRISARKSLFFGVVALGVLTVGLTAALEDVRPEWRDPEFGFRLQQLKEWKQKTPERPLVLALGSSRMQFDLSPAAMDFSDEPDEPLVYNLGYRGSRPNLAALNLVRVLDAGIRPRCVLIEFSPIAYAHIGMTQGNMFTDDLRTWPSRFSLRDVGRMWELDESPSDDRGVSMRWLAGYATPWSTQRLVLLSRWLPNWLPQIKTVPVNVHAQPSDRYGFAPAIAITITDENRRLKLLGVQAGYNHVADMLAKFGRIPPLSPITGVLVRRCRAEGIPVAFVWLPESPNIQGWFPQFQAIGETYAAKLTRDYGVALFPAPHQPEEDFRDGVHLLPSGAQRYSRWLADTHLKPWLVGQGLMRP